MELHSYAKRKAAKKWTIEQKRKLVEARIAHDNIFAKKPSKCLATWKKIVTLAKLEDFNVTFVRKQWSNMVIKYKQYKRSRLGSTATNAVDDELLRRTSEEWEFFLPIHEFMSRKITNLHSYALAEGQKQKQSTSNVLTLQQQQEQDENNASLASQLEKMLASHDNGSSPEIEPGQNIAATFSSDTNEDYAAAAEIVASEVMAEPPLPPPPPPSVPAVEQVAFISEQHDVGIAAETDNGEQLSLQLAQNTDHDFYSKKSPKQRNYFSDGSNDEAEVRKQLPRNKINNSMRNNNKIKVAAKLKATTKSQFQSKRRKTDYDDDDNDDEEDDDDDEVKVQNNNKPSSSKYCKGAQNVANSKAPVNGSEKHQKPKLSERDKYYRHKRRFNRRLETRFDKLLNVFGQIIKAEYPSINVSPLLGTAAASNNNGTGLKFPDLDEEDYLNGYHTHGGFSSSGGASSTEDFYMNSSNDGDDDDDVDNDVNGEVIAESQKKETAAGKM